mgnify:CR=1 FL=1
MTLRKKTLAVIGATLVALIAALYGISQLILLSSFAHLEEDHTRQHVEQIAAALTDDLAQLGSTVGDWAPWDETYVFVEDRNPDYITGNLNEETLVNLRLNLIVFVNASGEIVFGKAIDLQTGQEAPFPQHFEAHLFDDCPLLTPSDEGGAVTGIVQSPEGPLLIASHPILTSQREGPARGTLIVGRYLDSAEIQRLSAITHLPVTVRPVDDAQIPTGLSAESPIAVQVIDADTVVGYALMTDIYGAPALVLQADVPRDIYRHGQTSVSYFVLALVVVGLVSGGMTLLLVERLVLARLARLSEEVTRIGAHGDPSARVSVTGRDELSRLADATNAMLASLEQSQRRLRESEERYRTLSANLEQMIETRTAELRRVKERVEAILNHSPDAILLLRDDGSISAVNQAFSSLFDYSGDEAFDQPPTLLIEPAHADAFNALLRAALDQAQASRSGIAARRKDGGVFDADVILAPIQEAGVVSGLVCSIRDISALKEVERMKDAFVSNVTHELRTPIASLKLYHDLLRRNPDKSAVYMARLERETDRLEHTIEDLLLLSRLDQQRVALTFAPLDLNALAEQYVSDRAPLAERQGLRIDFSGHEGLPAVQADSGLLGQAVSILLTNALNYTPAGGQVKVSTGVRQVNGRTWAGITVSDTGPGIPPDEQPHLFSRFFRGNAGNQSGKPGTGLGLAIAKEIVERHAGHVEVVSEGVPGKGAAFCIWLPLAGDPA